MTEFTTDNTEGYTADDLAILNAAWESLPLTNIDPDELAGKSLLDHVAEQLLAEFDAGKRGADLTEFYYAP